MLLERRRAVVRAFEALPPTVPAGALDEIEVLSAPGSTRAQVRLRLLPGGTGPSGGNEPVEWHQPSLPGFELEAALEKDGSQTVRGEVAAERSRA
jgi:hypothetical protein